MGYTKYIEKLYRELGKKTKTPETQKLREILVERKKEYRAGKPIERVEKPTRPDKARKYGYKAKQGFVIVRARVRRGGLRKSRPVKGRRPKRQGTSKITAAKSTQRIGEERAQKKFPNLNVLGSYWLWEDGQNKWYEVVMVDPSHPVIKADKDVNWVCNPAHNNRALRGLTPAGKKGRGQVKKTLTTTKNRPSIRANKRRAK